MTGRDGDTSSLTTALMVRLGEVTNRTFVLPLVIFYPTSRCNSRCVSCDWWQHGGDDDLTLDEIDALAAELPRWGTRLVAFSGGEPLLRSEVFEAAECFRRRRLRLHLLTSAVLLDRCVEPVARLFEHVIVSLDAATAAEYQTIRGVDGLAIVERGVARLRQLAPHVPVTARATIHRMNFREIGRLIERARAMAMDGISFVAADLSSSAFGRRHPPDASALALDRSDVSEFRAVIEHTITHHGDDFASGFLLDSPEKLRRLARVYEARNGDAPLPPVECNAPWVSIVIEANGTVRPCFFHEPIGSIRHAPLASIVADNLRQFRQSLTVRHNPVCQKCVCSLKTSLRAAPWRA